MTHRDGTDGLITALALENEDQTRPLRLGAALPLAVAAGGAVAVVLSLAMFGTYDGLAGTLAGAWFYRKIACMTLIAFGASVVLGDLARPGCRQVRYAALLPGFVSLATIAAADTSGLGLRGRMPLSVPICFGAIVLLALPAFALILFALRASAAVVRPRWTGAAAGLLAGSLAGGAYALVCLNDGGLFVALWYGAAIGSVAALGAGLGRKALAW